MRTRLGFLSLSLVVLSALILGECDGDGMINGFQAFGLVIALGLLFVTFPKR